MSALYGTLGGGKAQGKTYRGSNAMEAHIRGWNVGVRVSASRSDEGRVTLKVYRTGGSNGTGCETLIETIEEGD